MNTINNKLGNHKLMILKKLKKVINNKVLILVKIMIIFLFFQKFFKSQTQKN